MSHYVVIGGGVVGLTTAWALSERGHKVTVVDQATGPATGASYANGGQLSYRYVSPLADSGVPAKALAWLIDSEGPLRFKPSLDLGQWQWICQFLLNCRSSVNARATARLLALGSFSKTAFDDLVRSAGLDGFELRAPGKLVVYRNAAEFSRARLRTVGDGANGDAGGERALDADGCVALEPALADAAPMLAGGVYTPGEAVADCKLFCERLHERLLARTGFQWLAQTRAVGFRVDLGKAVALRTMSDEIEADGFIIAAGLQSRALARTIGISLPIYPLKGYSLSAPIGPDHRPPQVSVTDFERKVLYARIGEQLRVAAMVDMVGEDDRLDPARIATLNRTVRATMPRAADYDKAQPWAGLRPATPSGAPILGPTRTSGVWLNVGHGALGFTFATGTARIVAHMVDRQPSPMPLEGLAWVPAA